MIYQEIMKKMISNNLMKACLVLVGAMVAILIAGCDKGDSAKTGGVKEAESAKEAEPAKETGASAGSGEDKVAASLKGKLIGLKGGDIADAELTGNPEYYVLYHSASW
jgi:hypothetical protein